MIWGFGDSFTWGHGCRADGPNSEYYHNYKKDGDKIWLEWLGEWYGEDVKNISMCGASNDKIYDWVLENYYQIKEGDKVIIGMTIWGRIDIPINNEWVSILSILDGKRNAKVVETLVNSFDLDENLRHTIIDFQYHFSSNDLWEKKWKQRFDFLIKLLNKKGCKTMLFQISEPIVIGMETISKVSDIPDGHFSFGGHKRFAELVYKKLNPTLL